MAVRPFRVKKVLTPCTLELEIPLALRGRAVPVFHSSDLIPYETRVLDPADPDPEETELWRRVERDGFPREEMEERGGLERFPREEDIDTTPGV